MTDRRGGDQGTAVVGTLIGFVIVLVLLLFAVQVVIRLYATSALTSAADRAAGQVASAASPSAAIPAAETGARADLGGFGATHTRFDWVEVDGEQVVLRVTGQAPELIPGLSAWSTITRTVTVRTERFR